MRIPKSQENEFLDYLHKKPDKDLSSRNTTINEAEKTTVWRPELI